jgi:WD40 repeat protein
MITKVLSFTLNFRGDTMKRYILLFSLIISIILLIDIANGEDKLNLEKLIVFEKGERVSSISMNNNDELLLLSTFIGEQPEVTFNLCFYKRTQVLKKISNATNGTFSPNGKYYTFIKDKLLYLNNEKDKLLAKIPVKGTIENVVWSYDSGNIYICQQDKDYKINRYDLKTKEFKEVLSTKKVYFHPVTVINKNVLYLLENKYPGEAGADCSIVQFDLTKKKFEQVKLPEIKDLWIFDCFSISPDGKIAIFENANEGVIYLVDLINLKVIDTINTFENSMPGEYYWKSDGSYVLFTMSLKEIIKYRIPKF